MRRPVALAVALLLVSALAACGSDGRAQPPGGDRTRPLVTQPGAAGTDPAARRSVAPSGAAGTEPAARPAPTEPYAVGQRMLTMTRNGDRRLGVTVWYPATGRAGGRPRSGAHPAGGRFPLVVFSHGLGGAPVDYEPLLVGWAAAGFVVAAPRYPHTSGSATSTNVLDVLNQPADASYVLTGVLGLDARKGDPLRGHIDTARVGAAGHSAGAITTIGLFTLARDERLDAGVVLAGSSLGVGVGYRGRAAPLLFVHGGKDDVVSYASGKAAYDAVPWPKAMLTLPNGDHGRALQNHSDPAFRVVARTTLDFLRWSLYGDQRAKLGLERDAESTGVGSLDDRLG